MIDSHFARVLEARRGYFNARFAEKQIAQPQLDADVFLHILRQQVAPIVQAVAALDADRASVAGQNLYDLALDLYAQGLLGPAARSFILNTAWQEFFPAIAPFILQQPQRVPASFSNALYNMSQTPGARPDEWMQTMRAVALFCADAEIFLRAGQVAAWRAGMAHYRASALSVLKTLDAGIVRNLFGLDANAQIETDALHYALLANPWHVPAINPLPEKQIHIVKRVGAFRGFGGLFLSPPRVLWTRDGFVVQDGENSFLLFADAFGATFHRIENISHANVTSAFKLEKNGRVKNDKLSADFGELANATSSAANQTTLAVTTELTYGIYLIGLVG